MKLIVNASNLVIGGGIQVAVSLISELKLYVENEYHIFLSPKVESQLEISNFGSNFHFYSIKNSPSSLKKRKQILKYLNHLEYRIKPEVVFTVFGPSYWKPKAKHIQGFADGWCYNPKSIAFKVLSFSEKLKILFVNRYKNYYIKKDSDILIVETEIAKKNICKYLKINKNKIVVVGNTYNKYFDEYKPNQIILPKEDVFNLVTVSAFYKHKNLLIINEISEILKSKSEIKFFFHLTIDNISYDTFFKDNVSVVNHGPIPSKDCPKLYNKCDALFLPTLLETFTASYPEAMKMNKPILTSNLDFAVDICNNAALYFNPFDVNEIADKIILLSQDKTIYSKFVKNGLNRLKEFETANSRVKKYLNICKKYRKITL